MSDDEKDLRALFVRQRHLETPLVPPWPAEVFAAPPPALLARGRGHWKWALPAAAAAVFVAAVSWQNLTRPDKAQLRSLPRLLATASPVAILSEHPADATHALTFTSLPSDFLITKKRTIRIL